MQDNNNPETDPVFQGLTRPATFKGVPVVYMGFLFMFGAILLIASMNIILTFFLLLPVYLIGYLLTEKDAFWMNIIVVRFVKKIWTIRNFKYWGCNSHTP